MAEKALETTGNQAVTPMSLLQNAQATGASIEQMQQLMELQLKWEANEAKKAFNVALASFKTEGVKIIKDNHVEFKTTKGMTEYDHATLGGVVDQITPILSKYGLFHNWNVSQGQDGIEVSCKVSHSLGHSDEVKIKAGPDDSGGKNKIQQIGSTITYLQRYTLLSALGLATHEKDDDGGGSEGVEYINLDQVNQIEDLLEETNSDKAKFLNTFGATSIDTIPAPKYNSIMAAFKAKKEKAA